MGESHYNLRPNKYGAHILVIVNCPSHPLVEMRQQSHLIKGIHICTVPSYTLGKVSTTVSTDCLPNIFKMTLLSDALWVIGIDWHWHKPPQDVHLISKMESTCAIRNGVKMSPISLSVPANNWSITAFRHAPLIRRSLNLSGQWGQSTAVRAWSLKALI